MQIVWQSPLNKVENMGLFKQCQFWKTKNKTTVRKLSNVNMGDAFLKRLLQFTMSENITGLLKIKKKSTISNDTHSEFRDWKYTLRI